MDSGRRGTEDKPLSSNGTTAKQLPRIDRCAVAKGRAAYVLNIAGSVDTHLPRAGVVCALVIHMRCRATPDQHALGGSAVLHMFGGSPVGTGILRSMRVWSSTRR